METPRNLRFKTFLLQHSHRKHRVRYIGRREMIIPSYKKPVYIRCLLEFDCEYIPVIDPLIWFRGLATPISNSMCVLVVEHSCEYQKLRTGVIITNIREVANFSSKTKPLSFNARFLLKLPKKANFCRLLNFSHFELLRCAKQKQADEDFTAFEKKNNVLKSSDPRSVGLYHLPPIPYK